MLLLVQFFFPEPDTSICKKRTPAELNGSARTVSLYRRLCDLVLLNFFLLYFSGGNKSIFEKKILPVNKIDCF